MYVNKYARKVLGGSTAFQEAVLPLRREPRWQQWRSFFIWFSSIISRTFWQISLKFILWIGLNYRKIICNIQHRHKLKIVDVLGRGLVCPIRLYTTVQNKLQSEIWHIWQNQDNLVIGTERTTLLLQFGVRITRGDPPPCKYGCHPGADNWRSGHFRVRKTNDLTSCCWDATMGTTLHWKKWWSCGRLRKIFSAKMSTAVINEA
jgi:hypothetical protein